MTAGDFRRLALSFAGAVEQAHMGHPDFRANGRIFATLAGDGHHGMVKLAPEVQQAFLRDHPDVFFPAAGAWGLQGATMVRLKAADEETVGAALTEAWRRVSGESRKPRGSGPRRRSRRAPR
jgi:hypothetical protein